MEESNAQILMKKSFALVLVIFVFLSLFFIFCKIEREQVLVLEDVEQKQVTVLPVKEGKFILKFVHSVHQTPVWEEYVIDETDNMVLKETRYYSLGVGMPCFTEEEGAFSNDNGEFCVTGLNRKYQKLSFLVSPIPQHTIIIDNENHPLLDFCQPDSVITIMVDVRWVFNKRL